jgi:hypothetical protein
MRTLRVRTEVVIIAGLVLDISYWLDWSGIVLFDNSFILSCFIEIKPIYVWLANFFIVILIDILIDFFTDILSRILTGLDRTDCIVLVKVPWLSTDQMYRSIVKAKAIVKAVKPSQTLLWPKQSIRSSEVITMTLGQPKVPTLICVINVFTRY